MANRLALGDLVEFAHAGEIYAGRIGAIINKTLTIINACSENTLKPLLVVKTARITKRYVFSPSGVHTQDVVFFPVDRVVKVPVVNEKVVFASKKRKEAKSPKGKDFYHSRKWLDLRYQALRLLPLVCTACGATKKGGAIMHVDHVKPKSLHPELTYELSNLQILCAACNFGKGIK